MVRLLVRYFKMAAVIARACSSKPVAAGLSACLPGVRVYSSSSSFVPGPSNGHLERVTVRGVSGNCKTNHRRSNRARPMHLPPKMSTRAAAAFSSTTKQQQQQQQQQVRPLGAAKLESIDFNPTASTAYTPVVIMHGLLGNSRNFQGWGAKLVKSLDQERRVFAVDMRNHGASSHHDSMTYVNMADDVLGFLADKGLSEAVLVGHSMGGKAAAMTALLHPEVVRGLIVMDIAPVSYSMHDIHVVPTFIPFNPPPFRVDATNWGETQKIIEAIHRMPLDGVTSRRDADELLAKDIVDPGLRAFAVTNLDKDKSTGGWTWKINIDAIQRSMGTLAQFESGKCHQEAIKGRLGGRGGGGDDDTDELGAYKGDTMFIAGGNSRYIRSQHLKEIGKLFPKFVVSTVKGAGHWVHADNPAETLRLAKSFLDRPELG
ncbi:unnamed protein product [Pylaiella littoralis]